MLKEVWEKEDLEERGVTKEDSLRAGIVLGYIGRADGVLAMRSGPHLKAHIDFSLSCTRGNACIHYIDSSGGVVSSQVHICYYARCV